MWVNNRNPTKGDWYIVNINGEIKPLMFNEYNLFWCGMDGKTYKPKDIFCWLDHWSLPLPIEKDYYM